MNSINTVEIIADNIWHNIGVYQKALPNQYFFPCLKSNAYGHGIRQVATILKDFDTPYFAVDSYFEAEKIWETVKRPVLQMGADLYENYKNYDFENLAVVVYDEKIIRALGDLKQNITIHLFVNTGMNREGVHPNKLFSLLKILKEYPLLQLEGVMSHFADADNPDNTYTKSQEKIFSECLDIIIEQNFYPKYIHLGNSAGAIKTTDPRINTYRVGISLYGYQQLQREDPFFQKIPDLKPALRITSHIVNTIHLKKGEAVSYNCTFKAQKDMRIGTIPVGYYEALDRKLSNTGYFSKGKGVFPIVGRVCMNLTGCDIENSELEVGDKITLISEKKEDQNSVENIAKITGTIPYEVCTRIAESVERKIV